MRIPPVFSVPSGGSEQDLGSLKRFSFRRTAHFVIAVVRFSRGLRKYQRRQHRRIVSMGNALTEPITDKHSECLSNPKFMVGSSCMQGWRNTMEDAHVHLLDFTGSGENEEHSSYFAVFDGHFNSAVAEHCGKNLHLRVHECQAYREGNVEEAFRTCFLALDREILDSPRLFRRSGSTGVVVVTRGNTIYCANAGDSRAILCDAGRAVPLSHDHKPSRQDEERRIQAAGGFVHMNRVNGSLAVSRGFGDSELKENKSLPAEAQMVTAVPDIISYTEKEDQEFFLLACDGIWDCKSNQEVADFVRERVAAKMLPDQICEELMMSCLSLESRRDGLGCDNMTVVLAIPLHGKQYEDAAVRCQRPCSPSVHASSEPAAQDSDLVMDISGEEASAPQTGADDTTPTADNAAPAETESSEVQEPAQPMEGDDGDGTEDIR